MCQMKTKKRCLLTNEQFSDMVEYRFSLLKLLIVFGFALDGIPRHRQFHEWEGTSLKLFGLFGFTSSKILHVDKKPCGLDYEDIRFRYLPTEVIGHLLDIQSPLPSKRAIKALRAWGKKYAKTHPKNFSFLAQEPPCLINDKKRRKGLRESVVNKQQMSLDIG